MPISPMDEFLAHQTAETFDRVSTSDRNFYARYYFNLHACSDELFLIAGLGQYPNLGVTDAFVTVSHGDKQYTVRASRELGIDRLDRYDGEWGHGVYQGELEVEGMVHDIGAPTERLQIAGLNETLCRFDLDTGEVGWGMHENMVIGAHHPSGIHSSGDLA